MTRTAARSFLLPISSLCVCVVLSAAVATAGTVGPVFAPPYDFDQSGTSDVLLHKITGTNTGINETQVVTGTTSTSRGWPDLNVGDDLTLQYRTRGAGNFDGNANGQAQIFTRKIVGGNPGLGRIVKLQPNGTARFDAAPTLGTAQFFVGGPDLTFVFLGIGDFNADGTDDIAYYADGGPNIGLIRIQYMDPATPFTVLTTSFPGVLPTSGGARGMPGVSNTPIGVADADGDGQADIWTVDQSTDAIEVLLSADDIDTNPPGGGFSGSAFPTTRPTGYRVAGLALFNRADAQADILFENLSNPNNPGVLRIDYTGDGGGPTNAPPTTFPTLLDVSIGETTVGVGDYDGLNQQDLLTRLFSPVTPANTGALVVRLMNSDGTDLAGNAGTLPEIEDLQYEVVDGSPLTGM